MRTSPNQVNPVLEQQYNPRATVPDFQRFLDTAAAASVEARRALQFDANIRIGNGPRQLIDFYPCAIAGAPCVVYVHGGFWRALSKEHAAAIALSLVPHGISAALVGYDLCPGVTLDEIVREVRESLVWCSAYLPKRGVHPALIHLCGSSAGAHLIASALLGGCDELGFASAWLVSGIYDLAPVLEISVNEDIRLDEAAVERNSPLRHVSQLSTPLHLRVGEEESQAWIEQSSSFASACRAAGCEVSFELLSGAHHFTTGISTAGSPLNQAMVAHISAWRP